MWELERVRVELEPERATGGMVAAEGAKVTTEPYLTPLELQKVQIIMEQG